MFGQCCFDVGDINLTMGTGSFININTGKHAHASVAGQCFHLFLCLLANSFFLINHHSYLLVSHCFLSQRKIVFFILSKHSLFNLIFCYLGLYPLVGWKIGSDVTYLAEGNAAGTGTAIEWAGEMGRFTYSLVILYRMLIFLLLKVFNCLLIAQVNGVLRRIVGVSLTFRQP